jgi:hypothetical protein
MLLDGRASRAAHDVTQKKYPHPIGRKSGKREAQVVMLP